VAQQEVIVGSQQRIQIRDDLENNSAYFETRVRQRGFDSMVGRGGMAVPAAFTSAGVVPLSEKAVVRFL
jgi:hypothetical protein